MPEQQSRPWDWRTYARRRWLWWLIGLALLFILALVLTPYGLGYGLKRAMLDQGLEQVELGDLDFNPFTGHLTVDDLRASAGGRVLFNLPEGSLDLGWFPLLRKRVFIEQVTLRGAEIVLAEQDDGSWRYGGFEPPWEEKIAPVEDTETLWEVGARELRILDSHYIVEGTRLRAEVDIEEARLQRATPWEPERAGELSIRARINGADLRVEAEAWPFAATPRIKGQVELTGLGLDPLAPISRPALETLEGTLGLEMNLEGLFRPESGLEFSQEGRLEIAGLKARNERMDLADESIRWEGSSQVVIPTSGLPRLSANGSLTQADMVLSVPAEQVTVRHRSLSWKGELDYVLQEKGTEAVADGRLELKGLDASRLEQKITNEQAVWEGRLGISLSNDGSSPELKADGKLRSSKLSATTGDGMTFRHEALAWQGNLHQWSTSGSLQVKSMGKLQVSKAGLDTPVIRLADEGLRWDGSLRLGLPEKGEPQVTTSGRLEGDRFTLGFPESGLRLQHEAFVWEGMLVRRDGGGERVTSPDSELTIRQFEVLAPDRGLKLLSLGSVRVEGLGIEGSQGLRAASAQLDDLSMVTRLEQPVPATGERQQALLTATGVTVQRLTLNQGGHLSMDVIQGTGAKALLRRNRDGRWYLLHDLAAVGKGPESSHGVSQPKPASGGQAAMGSPPSPTLRIGLARLKDSQLQFEDEAVEPPLATTVKVAAAHIAELDSGQPERRSEVGFKGTIDKYTKMDFRGYIQPFAERLTLDVTAQIDGLELPPVAPYTISEVGYTFTSGELDMDLDLRSQKGELEGESRFVFYRLEVEPLADATPTEKQEDRRRMPIGTALNLLRDKDNNIRVKVPISGDIDDPQFSLQEAINKALSKASRKTALTSLKIAIQPYGAIVTAVEIAGKTATVIRLDPITFNGADATLTGEGEAYLEKVAGVLRDRPRVHLKLCGKAVAADRLALQAEAMTKRMKSSAGVARTAESSGQRPAPALPEIPDAELKALAKARAVQVEDHLVERHGIDAGRLVLCRARMDTVVDARPRVDLEI